MNLLILYFAADLGLNDWSK